VLDEPSAHLDEAGALALLALLNDLRQRGCTVIVVTHARAMLQAADRILSLDSGQIVADDTAVAPPQTS
jgi:ABC-type protease/lipase transport system fused ATPase/permease subunit